MTIELEVIMPQKGVSDISALQVELKNILKEVIDEAEGHYDAVTETWDHNPDIEREQGMSGKDYYDQVGSDDDPMLWLDDGTSVRFAVMTKDFEAKTFVRELRSGPGAGGVAFVGKEPQPGIEARNWTDEIAKLVQPKLEVAADAAIAKALK